MITLVKPADIRFIPLGDVGLEHGTEYAAGLLMREFGWTRQDSIFITQLAMSAERWRGEAVESEDWERSALILCALGKVDILRDAITEMQRRYSLVAAA